MTVVSVKKFSDLLGKEVTRLEISGDEVLIGVAEEKGGGFYERLFMLYHEQDCCESVTVDDVVGDVDDIVGEVLTMAEESTNSDEPGRDYYEESYTWTYYRFATARGYLTVKFYGASNGYYSESVHFREVVTYGPH